MDQLSVNLQATTTNVGYPGENLTPAAKEKRERGIRDLANPDATILGYDLFGSLESALSFGGGKRRKRFSLEDMNEPQGEEDAEASMGSDDVILKGDAGETKPEPESVPLHFSLQYECDSELPLIVAPDEASHVQVAVLFRSVPREFLRRVVDFDCRFYVLEKGKCWPALESLSRENLELPGAYVPRLKACFVYKEILGRLNFENLPLILLAHAYDHALGGDNFASLKSPAVQSLYLACKQRKPGHQFMSGYSEAGPLQYFAQSMAAFFSPENRLWGRSVLKAIDFCMFEYLGCLFGATA